MTRYQQLAEQLKSIQPATMQMRNILEDAISVIENLQEFELQVNFPTLDGDEIRDFETAVSKNILEEDIGTKTLKIVPPNVVDTHDVIYGMCRTINVKFVTGPVSPRIP